MPDPASSNDLLTSLLRDVSRSFYLTLRVLPAAIRPQIGLAYLLARATDTIADTEIVPVAERLAALATLRARILGESEAPIGFASFTNASANATPAECLLLARFQEALAVLENFTAADRQLVREVLSTITGGQQLDLQRFAGAHGQNLVALATAAELDDYTYRVAGCVGEFWTKICRAHLFPRAEMDEQAFLQNGIRFGKGLQLVNILRDLPRDLAQGRCYLPADQLRAAGLAPADLLRPENERRFRPVYDPLLALAESHLAAGWTYTNTLSHNQRRVRLACAWPVLIGVRTLALLRRGNPLDPAQRIKVTRSDVRKIMGRSLVGLLSAKAWREQFERCRR